VLLVVRVRPAGEVTEVDEQAQAGQPLGKVAGLPDVASWCWPAVRDQEDYAKLPFKLASGRFFESWRHAASNNRQWLLRPIERG
jgi:hypothetical protein